MDKEELFVRAKRLFYHFFFSRLIRVGEIIGAANPAKTWISVSHSDEEQHHRGIATDVVTVVAERDLASAPRYDQFRLKYVHQ